MYILSLCQIHHQIVHSIVSEMLLFAMTEIASAPTDHSKELIANVVLLQHFSSSITQKWKYVEKLRKTLSNGL